MTLQKEEKIAILLLIIVFIGLIWADQKLYSLKEQAPACQPRQILVDSPIMFCEDNLGGKFLDKTDDYGEYTWSCVGIKRQKINLHWEDEK